MKMSDISTYGFMGAIRKHFEVRAEARKPPPTEGERIRKAINDLYSFQFDRRQPPYAIGRYMIERRHYHYDGDRGDHYTVCFNGTLIWSGTCYGFYNPFHGHWHLTGPWQDDLVGALESVVAELSRIVEAETVARILREQEELAAEERAAEERHQALIAQFNSRE